jgi:hypothetical protein
MSMRPGAEILDELVVVRACKAVYVLTPEEVAELLHRDRVLWAKAIRRGKSLKRRQSHERRQAMCVCGLPRVLGPAVVASCCPRCGKVYANVDQDEGRGAA